MTRDEWQNAERKIDPNFEGSTYEAMGCFTGELCPNCGAHLTKGTMDGPICLNACHLGDDGAKRFADHMRAFIGCAGDEE